MAGERKPRRERHTPKGKAIELKVEERREKALHLRRNGWSIREIARTLGCSPTLVHRDLTEVLERTMESADEYARQERELSLARIDAALKAMETKLERGDLDAVDRLVKLETRRARLLGLDAPTRTELTGAAGAPVSLDARTDILGRLASLAAGGAAVPAAAGVPGEPDPAGA